METNVCVFFFLYLCLFGFGNLFTGDGLYWKAEEKDIQIENLKRELQEKEESIKALKAQLVSVEKERYKKEREFDLLKQSLRIMNGKKNSIQIKGKHLKTKLGK